jgi:hypothetical protein
VALSWLLAQRPWIVPIPCTTKVNRLQEHAGAVDVELTAEDLEETTAAADKVDVQGERYPCRHATVDQSLTPDTGLVRPVDLLSRPLGSPTPTASVDI